MTNLTKINIMVITAFIVNVLVLHYGIKHINKTKDNSDKNQVSSEVINEEIPYNKNNNPLNVKGNKWAGQIGTDKNGHAIFSHPYYSLRAAAKILIKYQKEHNLKTLDQIIHRYARTNRKKYVNYLCRRVGIKPNEEIDVLQYLPDLLKHMVVFESGTQIFPEEVFILLSIHSNIQRGEEN